MNSLIDHLLGDTSCTVDGTQVSSNPLSMIASGLIDNTYQQPNISHQNQSNEGFYYRNQGQGNNLDVAGSTMYHQNSFSNSQFAQMSIGNNLSLTQQHQSQNHTNEVSL